MNSYWLTAIAAAAGVAGGVGTDRAINQPVPANIESMVLTQLRDEVAALRQDVAQQQVSASGQSAKLQSMWLIMVQEANERASAKAQSERQIAQFHSDNETVRQQLKRVIQR